MIKIITFKRIFRIICGLRAFTATLSRDNWLRFGIYHWGHIACGKCASYGYRGYHAECYFGKWLLTLDTEKYDSREIMESYIITSKK